MSHVPADGNKVHAVGHKAHSLLASCCLEIRQMSCLSTYRSTAEAMYFHGHGKGHVATRMASEGRDVSRYGRHEIGRVEVATH